MNKIREWLHILLDFLWNETDLAMRAKLIMVFLVVNIIPSILLTVFGCLFYLK